MPNLKISHDVGPVAEDKSVTGLREQPQMGVWQYRGQRMRLRCRDRAVLTALEDPHFGADLVDGKAPRPTLQCTIPAVRVDSLLDRFPDRADEHVADGWILQKLHVRFW